MTFEIEISTLRKESGDKLADRAYRLIYKALTKKDIIIGKVSIVYGGPEVRGKK